MSTNELTPSNSLIDAEGLSLEPEAIARGLKIEYDNAHFFRQRNLKESAADYGYLGFVPRSVDRAMDKWDERSAIKAAVKHYQTHEGAYQEQAVKDAAAKGVHTNFGEK
jgi:hypothetical protein